MEQEEKKEKFNIPPKTEEELKQIAMDVYDGKIFCDRHLENPLSDLPSVFMVIGLGGLSDLTKEEINMIGMIYEYISEAGPRSVNGYPSFFSMRILSKEDTNKMLEHYDAYKKIKEEFLKK